AVIDIPQRHGQLLCLRIALDAQQLARAGQIARGKSGQVPGNGAGYRAEERLASAAEYGRERFVVNGISGRLSNTFAVPRFSRLFKYDIALERERPGPANIVALPVAARIEARQVDIIFIRQTGPGQIYRAKLHQ